MGGFTGFVQDTRYTSLPNALLGPLLEEIDSVGELKCTLRILALIYQRRGARPWLTLEELQDDQVLLNGLAQEEGGALQGMRRGVSKAVDRGTLLKVSGQGEEAGAVRIFVNDEQGRRAAERMVGERERTWAVEPATSEPDTESRPNIFTLYEENIGPLTPLLTDELQEAEATYPWRWIQDAFREAVELQRRNWRYISRILGRWAVEGKDHGEPGRYSQETDPKEYGRRYGPLSRR